MSHRTCFRVSNITLLTSNNSVELEIPKLVRNDNIVRIRVIQKYEIDYRLSNFLFSYQYARLRKYSFS